MEPEQRINYRNRTINLFTTQLECRCALDPVSNHNLSYSMIKKLLCTFVVLVSLFSTSSLFAWGWYSYRTHDASTYIGELAPGQVVMLDLIRGVNADTHLSLVDTNTETVVFEVYKSGDGNAEAYATGGAWFSIDNNGEYSIATIENLPATGDFRLDLTVGAYTYSPAAEAHTDFNGRTGGCWIDIGSDYEAWGGADIILE